jgi:hypothetical protein
MRPSANLRLGALTLTALALSACSETVDVPQTSLRDPRAALSLTWCTSADGSSLSARRADCADGEPGAKAVDRVAVADARLRAAQLLNANLDLPRFIDLSAATPGNTGIPLDGGPTRLAATAFPAVAVALLADDQWTRNADAAPAKVGLVAFDAAGATQISDVQPTSSLPAEIATATGGGNEVWVTLPQENVVQRFSLAWNCVAADGTRTLDCIKNATWTAGARVSVEGPSNISLSAAGRLFVARADGSGIEVFDTAGACTDAPCYLGRFTTLPSCSDGVDDDGDGRTDADDPQCFGPSDNENGDIAIDDASSCINGVDDNGDGLVDSDDPNCARTADIARDGNESGDLWGPLKGFAADGSGQSLPEGSGNCGDGVDNDDDGQADGRDPTCFRFVRDESGPLDLTACTDGIDNNGDGTTDADDPGCRSAIDAVEGSGVALPSCGNDLDDDSDGLTDELDTDCSEGSGSDELPGDAPTAPAATGTNACADGLDNDGDGAIDWPQDGGCRSADADTEQPATACSDGLDNDGDGATDWPADTDCYGPNDTVEARGRIALLGPMTLTNDDRVLVVSDQLARGLLFFDTLHLSRLDGSPGDPNRRQLGIAHPAAGVVTSLVAVREQDNDEAGATRRERFSVHVALSSSAGYSLYTHARDLERNITFPLFSLFDSNDNSAVISSLQCGLGEDAPGENTAVFTTCSSGSGPALWSEVEGAVSLPERWRYQATTDGLGTVSFTAERDDARMPDTSVAGLSWRFTFAGALPWTARADGHFLDDAPTGRWAILAGNDACGLPDLCGAFETGLCPALDSRCSSSPETAQADLCGSPTFDFCRACPALCSGSVSLCDAGVQPGDTLVLGRISILDSRANLSECAPYLGRSVTATSVPSDLRYTVTQVAGSRLALSPVTNGTPLPPATCYPTGFAFNIFAADAWVSRLDDSTGRPAALGSPAAAAELDGACVARPALQAARTRFAPGERLRHLSGLGIELPAAPTPGTEIRFGLTSNALSSQFAVGPATVALTYLPEQNLFFVTDAATATVQARYGLRVSGYSNFEPLDYALP